MRRRVAQFGHRTCGGGERPRPAAHCGEERPQGQKHQAQERKGQSFGRTGVLLQKARHVGHQRPDSQNCHRGLHQGDSGRDL